ncbi:hypothetical protein TNCV_446551 [Trichonephila clavipes]|nr:hypothetical protein TNCV_446551 [Trichonephila clavipes]
MIQIMILLRPKTCARAKLTRTLKRPWLATIIYIIYRKTIEIWTGGSNKHTFTLLDRSLESLRKKSNHLVAFLLSSQKFHLRFRFHMQWGHDSLVVKVTNLWLVCHEYKPSTAEDPACRGH